MNFVRIDRKSEVGTYVSRVRQLGLDSLVTLTGKRWFTWTWCQGQTFYDNNYILTFPVFIDRNHRKHGGGSEANKNSW